MAGTSSMIAFRNIAGVGGFKIMPIAKERIVDEKPKIITAVKARGAVKLSVMRYVLIISVALAIAAMLWTFLRAPDATRPDASTSSSTPATP